MGAAEVAVPLGALLTVAIFIQGAAVSRLTAAADAAPVQLAMLVAEDRHRVREHVQRPGYTSWLVLTSLLLGAAATIVSLAWLDGGKPGSVLLVVGSVFLLAQVLVTGMTWADVRAQLRRWDRARHASAAFAYLEALSARAGVSDASTLLQVHHVVSAFSSALSRVPPGVPDAVYRNQLAESRVALAERLLRERRPTAALEQIELALPDLRRVPGFLDSGGAHTTAALVADLGQLRLHEIKAAAHRMRGDVDAELDEWLEALRAAPDHFQGVVSDLVTAARKSGRLDDVRLAIAALCADEPEPEWAQHLRNAVYVKLDVDPLAPGTDLGELRLLDSVSPSSYTAHHLVKALLGHWDATRSPELLEEAEARLDEVAATTDEGTDAPQRHLRTQLLVRQDRLSEAYEVAVGELGEDPGTWPLDITTTLRLARATGRETDLLARIDAASPSTPRGSRRQRQVREQVDPVDPGEEPAG